MNTKLSQAQKKWLYGNDWTVFGTLKFTDGTIISKTRGLKLAQLFWQKLDCYYFGAATRRKNMRIERAVYAQCGKDAQSENLHFHFVAKPPLPEAFCQIASRTWGALDRWCDGKHSQIELARSAAATAIYSACETYFDGKRDFNSFRPEMTHFESQHAPATLLAIAEHRLFQRA